jgi:hypothetical protein
MAKMRLSILFAVSMLVACATADIEHFATRDGQRGYVVHCDTLASDPDSMQNFLRCHQRADALCDNTARDYDKDMKVGKYLVERTYSFTCGNGF